MTPVTARTDSAIPLTPNAPNLTPPALDSRPKRHRHPRHRAGSSILRARAVVYSVPTDPPCPQIRMHHIHSDTLYSNNRLLTESSVAELPLDKVIAPLVYALPHVQSGIPRQILISPASDGASPIRVAWFSGPSSGPRGPPLPCCHAGGPLGPQKG